MLKSNDTFFQKSGLARLRMVHAYGQASYMAPAVEQAGVESLLKLIVSGGGGAGVSPVSGTRGASKVMRGTGGSGDAAVLRDRLLTARETATREVAGEALQCLMTLAAAEGVLGLMAARKGLPGAVLEAARNSGLDAATKDQLNGLHAKLVVKHGGGGGEQ